MTAETTPSMLRHASMLWFARLSCLMGLLLGAAPLRAEGAAVQGVRLSFVRTQAASSCISASALEREIARRMGYDPFEGQARQWIEGTIDRQADCFEVQLFERDADGNTLGSRRLRDPAIDCHKLDDAIVLAIALIIDPSVQLAPTTAVASPSAPPASSATAPALSPPPPSSVPAVAPPQNVGLEWNGAPRAVTTPERNANRLGTAFVSADAVMIGGVLPGAAFGAESVARLALDSKGTAALRLSGLYLPEKVKTTDAGELGYSLTALEAGGCLQGRAQRFGFFGCLGFGLGAVHSVVHNPEPLDPDDRLWAAFRLEAGASVRIAGPVWAEARLFDLLALRRWEFHVVQRLDGVQTASPVAFAQSAFLPGAALCLGLHFD